MAKERWIQGIDLKKGALHRQLGIPEDQKIPMGLLEKILIATPGDVIVWKGKKIKVTEKLQKRARLAKTFKKMH